MPGRKKVTTKRPMVGNKRSHSLRATRRQWKLNMQNKRFFVPELDQFVRIQVTAGEIRTIDKIGVVEFLKRQGKTVADMG